MSRGIVFFFQTVKKRDRCRATVPLGTYQQKLFQFYGSASFFQFGFHGFSVSFGNMFFDGVGSSINGSFGFFQAQAGQFPNNFDYVDLAGTSIFQNNVEFGLFSQRQRRQQEQQLQQQEQQR